MFTENEIKRLKEIDLNIFKTLGLSEEPIDSHTEPAHLREIVDFYTAKDVDSSAFTSHMLEAFKKHSDKEEIFEFLKSVDLKNKYPYIFEDKTILSSIDYIYFELFTPIYDPDFDEENEDEDYYADNDSGVQEPLSAFMKLTIHLFEIPKVLEFWNQFGKYVVNNPKIYMINQEVFLELILKVHKDQESPVQWIIDSTDLKVSELD